jgi:hypothetical protein
VIPVFSVLVKACKTLSIKYDKKYFQEVNIEAELLHSRFCPEA